MLRFLFYLILIVFPLGQLLRFRLPFFPESVKFQPIDLLVFSFSMVSFASFFKEKKKTKLPIFFKEMSLFGLIASFSLLVKLPNLTFTDFLPAFFYLLRLWNYFLFYFAITDFLSREEIPVFHYLVAEGLIIGVSSLFQYVFLPDTRFLFDYSWDEHYYRAIGFFFDPGFTGILLTLSFLILLVFVDEKKKEKKLNLLLKIFSGFLLLTIGLTFSRATYLSLFAGLTAFFTLKKKIFLLIRYWAFFIILVVCLPKPAGEGVDLFRKSSLLARSEGYYQSFSIVKDNFWLGIGFNNLRMVQRDRGYISLIDWQKTNAGAGLDNSFLFVWATTGIFGLISFIFLYWQMLRTSLRKISLLLSSRVVFISLISLISASFFANILFYPWVCVWLMLILGKYTLLLNPKK